MQISRMQRGTCSQSKQQAMQNRPAAHVSAPVRVHRCGPVAAQASASASAPWQQALAAAAVAYVLAGTSISPAQAEELSSSTARPSLDQVDLPETLYFGNGCFWGRQFDFVTTEQRDLQRKPEQVSAVVGYAGGRQVGPDGKVCYYVADPRTVYEKLGHAEVVQVSLQAPDEQSRTEEFRRFARTYFKQFKRTDQGMQRLDPQDAGPGYRNVVGLPGGTANPLFRVLQEENVNGMELREGAGNQYAGGRPVEDDLLNVVWVVDSSSLPFYRAETYHQFHNGIGKFFPTKYTWDLKNLKYNQKQIGYTGCPELPF